MFLQVILESGRVGRFFNEEIFEGNFCWRIRLSSLKNRERFLSKCDETESGSGSDGWNEIIC